MEQAADWEKTEVQSAGSDFVGNTVSNAQIQYEA